MAALARNRGLKFSDRHIARDTVSRPITGPIFNLFGFCKDTMQGVCAGILATLGAAHMVTQPNVSIASSEPGAVSLNAVLENIAMGGLTGPIEILGGLALFFAARRPLARTLGVLAFIGFLWAYTNGYGVAELLPILSALFLQFAGAVDAQVAALSVQTF
ncbi:MAG: hypothetical protein AAGB02_03255 [Pseudomonadota bacterium]